MAATFRKGNEGCFACGDKDLLKRDCPKKANKKPPRICPRCHRGMHWAKDCKSKFDIEGKPIPGNSKQVPFNKNQGQIPSFPSNLNIRQCCHWYTSLKWLSICWDDEVPRMCSVNSWRLGGRNSQAASHAGVVLWGLMDPHPNTRGEDFPLPAQNWTMII